MKKIVLGLCFILFTTGVFANSIIEKETYKRVFEDKFFYGCTVTVYWHDSSGSYSTSFRYSNINTQSGCFQKMVDVLAVLAPMVAFEPIDNVTDDLPTFYPEDLSGENNGGTDDLPTLYLEDLSRVITRE